MGNASIQHNPMVPFGVIVDTNGAVLLLIPINKFALVLYLPFLFKYLIELKLLQNLKNEAYLDLDMGDFIT